MKSEKFRRGVVVFVQVLQCVHVCVCVRTTFLNNYMCDGKLMHNTSSTWSHPQIFLEFLNIYQTQQKLKNLGLVVPNLSVKRTLSVREKLSTMKCICSQNCVYYIQGFPQPQSLRIALSLFLICKWVCERGRPDPAL